MNQPRRRWYQFSLRTFFVLVTLVCAGFGYWVHWSREWVRQRHEVLDLFLAHDATRNAERPWAPGGLWLFGEKGVSSIYFDDELDVSDGKERNFGEVTRLFPELESVSVRPPLPNP